MLKLNNQQTTLRFAIIGVIVLSMLIPLMLVQGVTDERQNYFNDTFRDIANAWGNEQNLTGPFLIVPEIHRYQAKDDRGELVWLERRGERVILPTDLNLEVDVAHQYRRRAIYDVPVYLADVTLSGAFPQLDSALLSRDNIEMLLEEAYLAIGISHTQAISSASALTMGDVNRAFTAGTGQSWIASGISAPVPGVSVSDATEFTFELKLKGTRQFGFTPVGDTTAVSMTSSWPHPSFNGRYLPVSYDITTEGFAADWMVHELARNLPGTWLVGSKDVDLNGSHAWVGLFQPLTDYRIVDRAIKYGMLFIALTFLGFVCFELTTALKFHPVQYGVVGAGLVLFYLALLSLSEHVEFGTAYLLATFLLTALISWYVWAITRTRSLTIWIAGIIGALYGTLYVLLKLEAFALLVGTAVLFIGLFALMYTTRTLGATQDEEIPETST